MQNSLRQSNNALSPAPQPVSAYGQTSFTPAPPPVQPTLPQVVDMIAGNNPLLQGFKDNVLKTSGTLERLKEREYIAATEANLKKWPSGFSQNQPLDQREGEALAHGVYNSIPNLMDAAQSLGEYTMGGQRFPQSSRGLRKKWEVDLLNEEFVPSTEWQKVISYLGESTVDPGLLAYPWYAARVVARLAKNNPVAHALLLKKFPHLRMNMIDDATDAAGNVYMTHWGKKPIDTLEVDRYLSGLSPIAEKNRGGIPRVYFALDSDNIYRPEKGLGNVMHKVKINRTDLYDQAIDDQGLWGSVKTPEDATAAEIRVRDAGYKGVVIPTHRGDIAMIFEDVRVPPAAADTPRVAGLDDVVAPQTLTRSSVGTNKFKVGAPKIIQSNADELSAVDNYLAEAEKGAEARDWYDVRHQQLLDDTGYDRPGALEAQAVSSGNYSARTTTVAEELAAKRAAIQHATGRPVAAGTGPRNEVAQRVLDTGQLNAKDKLKVDNYVRNIAGHNTGRMTHDFRDAIGFGFDEIEAGRLGPAQHRWLDEMADKAVDEANRRKLGGFDDWTHEKLQAAQWVQHKATSTGRSVQTVMQELDNAREMLRARVYSETIPSKELMDMSGMDDAGKEAYTRSQSKIVQNVHDQNALVQQEGLLGGNVNYGYGDFDGGVGPNIRTSIFADPEKGGSAISEWGKEAIEFHGALDALLNFQADVGYHYLRKAKKVGDINAVTIPFHRAVKEADRKSYRTAFEKALRNQGLDADVVVDYLDDNRIVVKWLGEGDPKGFRNIAKGITKGRATEWHDSGDLITKVAEYMPSELMKKLQNPKMRAAIEPMLPRMARDIEKGVSQLPLSKKGEAITRTLLDAIKSNGLKGVEDAVSKGLLPTAVLGAILVEYNQAQGSLSGEQGQNQPLPGIL